MSPQRFKCSECTNWTVESPDKSICDECLGRIATATTTKIRISPTAFNPINFLSPTPVSPPAERSLRRDIMNLNSEKLRVEAAWIAVAITNWAELEVTTGRSASEWAQIAAELEQHWRSFK